MSRLHRNPGHPYYIYAPAYRETSSGIQSLHYLCHALNLEGRDAYIVGTDFVNPRLKTPVLGDVARAQHQRDGFEPIVVYPEVIAGNPLDASLVVRYILNGRGVLAGYDLVSSDEMCFYFRPEFYDGDDPQSIDILRLQATDVSLFCLPSSQGPRFRKLLYVNRIPLDKIDLSRFPDSIEVLSMDNPLTLPALAKKLQEAEVLYSYESSSTCSKAIMCGCPVVALELPGYEKLAVSDKTLIDVGGGFCSSDEPKAIESAVAGIENARQVLNALEDQFWEQLQVFIDKTQAAADVCASKIKGNLTGWLAERVPTDVQRGLISERLASHREPVIGVVVLDSSGSAEKIKQTVSSLSLENHSYASVKILVLSELDVPSSSADTKPQLFKLDADKPQASIEYALKQVPIDWFMLVEAGVEFTPSGLMIAALDLLESQGVRAVYGDEIIRDQSADLGPILRPDLNLDLLLSLPSAMARHWLFNYQVWLEIGGFSDQPGKAFELDYILRLIELKGFAGLGHISEPLLIGDTPKLVNCPDEREVIVRHLNARGFDQAGVSATRPGHYEVHYFKQPAASVSILILAEGSLARLRRCMETLLEKTQHASYEVLLMVRGATDPALNDWLVGVEQLGTDAVKVMRFDADLSDAQVRNVAAELAVGEYLLWLDAGVAILDECWLQQLLNHAQRAEVGAVGAKLLSGDRTIAHGGLILGLKGPVSPAYKGWSMDKAGYMQRLVVDQNHTALSDQCLMVRRSLFTEAGGFDESPELSPYASVDLCLRLHSAGYLNVWTPRALLLISEEASPESSAEQQDAMYARWLPLLARDPAYNPNFLLDAGAEFTLAPSRLSWKPLSSWQPLPRVLVHPADNQGCGHYRMIHPLQALNAEGVLDGTLSWGHLSLTELERFSPDSIILQRQIGVEQIESMRRMKTFSSAFKVYELDDYIPNLPMKSVHRAQMPKDILRSLRKGLSYVDRFVVSTEALADALSEMHSDIRVVHNRLYVPWWGGLKAERRISKKPRVGWAGGASHTGDLEMIFDVVKELANEVEWVFFGMCPEKLRPYVHEYHTGVKIADYPKKLAQLNLDLALAPVEQNLFNECKSNLRLLEYGACGFPVVCSDVVCYQGTGLPVTLVRNRFRDWVDAIRMHLNDLDETARQGDLLRAAVQRDWMLEGDNLLRWRQAWLPS